MAGSLGTFVRRKYYYDDVSGTPVEITSKVLTWNGLEAQGVTEDTSPFGTKMTQKTPTGRGSVAMIELGGLMKTVDAGEIDALFADRIPEDPDTPSRTFTVDWTGTGERLSSIETYLLKYGRSDNAQNGLTKTVVQLDPTGDLIEIFPS